jgi:acyl-CoA thioesterase FadM
MAHEDEFTMIEDVVGPGEAGNHAHLIDYQTQELVSRLWSAYLAKNRQGLDMAGPQPAMRRVTYSLDNEAFAGDELQRGIKAISRTRRGFTCEAALWHKADGRMVHRAEIVTVWVAPGQGAVEIPEDFWANVEKMEGKAIPVTERA